ncbi:phage tail sheath family protein [Burkholderia sp. Bp9126]|nr:phage tail sheath family protein [Burkholderia sp. Bp9126]
MFSQPGVSLSEQVVQVPRTEVPSAVPVFIGWAQPQHATAGLVRIASWEAYKTRFGDAPVCPVPGRTGLLRDCVRHYFASGGQPCYVLPIAVNLPQVPSPLQAQDADTNADPGVSDEVLAHALCDETLFARIAAEPAITLLAAPDLALLSDTHTELWLQVWTTWLAKRPPGVFCVLDAPRTREATERLLKASNWTDGEHAAAYWPHLFVDGPGGLQDTPVLLPPSATVIAAMQRSDREHGVWKAPANAALPNVIKPEHSHWDAQNLFQESGSSINLIRSFAGRGVRVWGCRTLSSDNVPRHRYLQTRRLLSHIESSLHEVARFATFEPNNEITWMKLKGFIYAWLHALWLAGGLYGRAENEAFWIKVGLGETMTAEDVAQGHLVVRIGVAAMMPAEFIDLTLQLRIGETDAEMMRT